MPRQGVAVNPALLEWLRVSATEVRTALSMDRPVRHRNEDRSKPRPRRTLAELCAKLMVPAEHGGAAAEKTRRGQVLAILSAISPNIASRKTFLDVWSTDADLATAAGAADAAAAAGGAAPPALAAVAAAQQPVRVRLTSTILFVLCVCVWRGDVVW